MGGLTTYAQLTLPNGGPWLISSMLLIENDDTSSTTVFCDVNGQINFGGDINPNQATTFSNTVILPISNSATTVVLECHKQQRNGTGTPTSIWVDTALMNAVPMTSYVEQSTQMSAAP
jgi:hypothetical protein